MLWWFVQTSIVSAGLALVAATAGRLCEFRPAMRHVFWVVVLARMMTPPVVHWPWTLPVPGRFGGGVAAPAAVASSHIDGETTANRVNLRARRRDDIGVRPVEAISVEFPPSNPVPPGEEGPRDGPEIDARSAIATGWMAVTAVVIAVQLARIARFSRRLRDARPAPSGLSAEVDRLAREAGVRPPRVEVLPGLDTPMLWCAGRVRLLVPEGILDRLDPASRRCVIAHELAHLARRDHWVSRLELFAGWVWWWSPLYWWVRRRLGAEAELACDAWVVRRFPDDRRAFAEALLEVCLLRSLPSSPPPVLGIGGGPSLLIERRMRMILGEPIGRPVRNRGLLAGLAISLLGLPALPRSVPDDETIPTTAVMRPLGTAVAERDDVNAGDDRLESTGGDRTGDAKSPESERAVSPESGPPTPASTPVVDLVTLESDDARVAPGPGPSISLPGQSGAPPLPLIFTDSREIRIPFNIPESETADRIREIYLYMSSDRGASWEYAGATSPEQKAFPYRAPRDGEYWFTVRARDRESQLHPANSEQVRPKLRMIVDTTPPVVVVRARFVRRGVIGVAWEIRDENPDLSSFSLEYLVQGFPRGSWKREEAQPRLIGEDRWKAGSIIPQMARVTITDRAGNRTSEAALVGAPILPPASPGDDRSGKEGESPAIGSAASLEDEVDDLLARAARMPTDPLELVEIEILLQSLRNRLHETAHQIKELEAKKSDVAEQPAPLDELEATREALVGQIERVQEQLARVQEAARKDEPRRERGPEEISAASVAREVFGPGHWTAKPSFSFGTGDLRRFVYGGDSRNLGEGRYRLSPAAMVIIDDGGRPTIVTGDAAEATFDRDPMRAFEEGMSPKLRIVLFRGSVHMMVDDVTLTGNDLRIEGDPAGRVEEDRRADTEPPR